jgi:WD40 repeat protein
MAGGEQAPDPYSPHMYALPTGTLLQEFRIDTLLGHGGFGITYRAFDTDLHKAVAIKEYLPNDLASRVSDSTVRARSRDDQQQFEQGVAAFLDEARLVARVRHRNIMEVLRFFKLNGTGYIVLGYEEGRTLKQRLDDGPLAEGELRHLLGGLLDGLEALHAEAILHRDIKPSNIILSDSRVPGERAVPVLIDFGAARDFRSRHSRSVTTIVAPGYAPPEQYGIGGQAGPWSDLYALGATAYRCVTGEAPPEALRRLRKDPFVSAVTAATGRYDESLLRLIDRMLSVDEVDRPQSAAEVKAALRSRSVPVQTRDRRLAADGSAARTSSPSRSRRLAGIFATVVAAAVIAGGVVLWLDGTLPKFIGNIASKTKVETAVKTAAAPAIDKPAAPAPTPAVVVPPKEDVAPKAADTTAAPSVPAVAMTPKADAAPAQATPAPVVKRSLVDAVAAGYEPVANLETRIEVIRSVVFSPDGRTLAAGSGNTITLWDVASGRTLHAFAVFIFGVNSVAFSPDGRMLASVFIGSGIGGDVFTVKLWDVASGGELRTLGTLAGHKKTIRCIAFSPDGQTLASGSDDNTIKLWNIATGRELRTLTGHGEQFDSVAFSPDGRTLASGSVDNSWLNSTIRLWEVASGRTLRMITDLGGIGRVVLSPDGRTVVRGSVLKLINVWDVASGHKLQTFAGDEHNVADLAFSPDGRTMASAASGDHTVKLWDVASRRRLRTLMGHAGDVFSVAFSPDGQTLASGSLNESIILWSTTDGIIRARFIGNTYNSISFDGKGLPIAVSGNEDAIYHFVKDGKKFKPSEMRAMGYELPAPNPNPE